MSLTLMAARGRTRRSVGLMVVATMLLTVLGTVPAMADPVLGGADDATYVENDGPTLVAPGLTIADGLSYGGQYLEFSITGGGAGDILGLQDDGTADVTDGVVSIVGSSVYLGNGTTADIIGSIDGTSNGDGAPLKVNFTSDFQNAGFESGDLTGWTSLTSQIDLGATTIASCLTVDTSTYPAPVPNEDNNVPISLGSLVTPVVSDVVSEGTYALRLQSTGMTTLAGFDVVHGPAVYSGEFEAAAGDTIYFDWRAYAGADNYHVFGYIIDEACNQTELLDATGGGSTAWATQPTVIASSGTYRFVFVSGTFDATGGHAAGASLYIDNVLVFGNKVNDAVAQAVARKVTYHSTASETPDTRTLNVTAQSVAEGSSTTSLTINVETDPDVTTGVSGTAGNTMVDLLWDVPAAGSSAITDYLIEYSDDGGATWTPFDDGVSTDSAAPVTGLTNDVGYVFRVAAVNDAGAGPWSDMSETLTPTASVPGAPTGLDVVAGIHEATVSWNAPVDDGGATISDYIIEMSTDGGVTWTVVADGTSTESSFLVTGLTNDLEHMFRVAAVNAVGIGPVSEPAAGTPESIPPFVDSEDSIFAEDIQWLKVQGISFGCNPPLNTEFCPSLPLTRAETASFLDRWLGFPETAEDFFTDDEGSVHEAALNRAAAADVFRGCNPPANDIVCPDDVITRGEIAAVLVRGLGLEAATPAAFTDVVGHLFERETGVLGGLGVTLGCNPPANDMYCPDELITRGQMAAFLHRSSELD